MVQNKLGFRMVLENMKEMTWPQRISYFWDYYKWVVIIGIVLIAIFGMLIGELVNPDPESLFMGVRINVRITDKGNDYLTDDIFEIMGGTDPEKQAVDLLQRGLPTMEADSQYAQSEIMAMVAMVSAQMLDYVILDDVSFEQYRRNGMFSNLETLLRPDQLAQFEGKLHTTSTDDEGTYYAIIDITDTAFAKDCLSGSKQYYIAFPGNTGRADKLPAFVDWILAWGK